MAEVVLTDTRERTPRRDTASELHDYAHSITKALTGLVGGGSEMFAGRIAKNTEHEMFAADIPFCVQRIRDRFDMAHREMGDLVRKANAHDDLVAALSKLRKYAASVWFDEAIASDDDEFELMREARAALSKAGVK